MDHFELKAVGEHTTSAYSGQIKGSDNEWIYLEVAEKDCIGLRNHVDQKYFNISFKVNTFPYRIQRRALELTEEFGLHSRLINNEQYDTCRDPPDEFENSMDCHFCGKLASKLNDEQKIAVKNICKMKNSVPYLIFGPAGTGKTRTLVAAIEEIVRSTSGSVLVCANSNAACDEITQRLLSVLKSHEIFRIYAKSYNVEKSIKNCSNWFEGQFRFPCLKYLYSFRVVICTLLTAGNLVRARNDPNFVPGHFSTLIIDECASTNESTTLVPIAGMYWVFILVIFYLIYLVCPLLLNEILTMHMIEYISTY